MKKALKDEYQSYLFYYGDCTDMQARSLAKACAVLTLAVECIEDGQADVRKNGFFQDFAKVVDKCDVTYLPRNYRRLKEKIMWVYEGQKVTDVINLPRRGNANALRFDDKELVSWLVQMRAIELS